MSVSSSQECAYQFTVEKKKTTPQEITVEKLSFGMVDHTQKYISDCTMQILTLLKKRLLTMVINLCDQHTIKHKGEKCEGNHCFEFLNAVSISMVMFS